MFDCFGLRFSFLVVSCLTLFAEVGAQTTVSLRDAGRFYIHNFAPEDYESHNQNWSIVQGVDGLIYIGSGDGVLEYDGISWNLIRVENHTTSLSLAVDDSGRVHVGAVQEIGYLGPDSTGMTRYHSLMHLIDEEHRVFREVWGTFTVHDGVYFQAHNRLIRIRDNIVKVWEPETRFLSAFSLRDTLYVQHEDVGLMRVEGDSLVMAADGRKLSR